MAKSGLKITRYINKETGEVTENRSYYDLQFNDDGYLFWNRKANIKTFIERPLSEHFTWSEKGRINELKHYILRDNQFLVYRSNNVIKPITPTEMCRILSMSDRQCKALIRKMKKEKIIKEIIFDGNTYFAFNPLYGLKQRRLTLNVFLFFQKELADVLPGWVIMRFLQEAREMSPVFKIIK